MLTLETNIINLGQLPKNGYEVQITDHLLALKNKSRELIAQVDMMWNRLFPINIESGEVKCMKIGIKDNSWLWYLRFVHLKFFWLEAIVKSKDD